MAITTLSTKFKNAYDPFWLHSLPIWRRPVIRFVQTARAFFFARLSSLSSYLRVVIIPSMPSRKEPRPLDICFFSLRRRAVQVY